MNRQQQTYLQAKATMDETYAALTARLAPLGEIDESDAEIDAYVDAQMAAERAVGLDAAKDALQAAEESLFDWGIRWLREQPNGREVLALFPKMRQSIVTRHRMLDTLMRVKA